MFSQTDRPCRTTITARSSMQHGSAAACMPCANARRPRARAADATTSARALARLAEFPHRRCARRARTLCRRLSGCRTRLDADDRGSGQHCRRLARPCGPGADRRLAGSHPAQARRDAVGPARAVDRRCRHRDRTELLAGAAGERRDAGRERRFRTGGGGAHGRSVHARGADRAHGAQRRVVARGQHGGGDPLGAGCMAVLGRRGVPAGAGDRGAHRDRSHDDPVFAGRSPARARTGARRRRDGRTAIVDQRYCEAARCWCSRRAAFSTNWPMHHC